MGVSSAAMKSCVLFFALALAAVAFDHEDFAEEFEMVQDMPMEESLLTTVNDMSNVAPAHLREHVKVVAHHARLIEAGKAKAYAHNFTKSQAAIRSAIKSVRDYRDKACPTKRAEESAQAKKDA